MFLWGGEGYGRARGRGGGKGMACMGLGWVGRRAGREGVAATVGTGRVGRGGAGRGGARHGRNVLIKLHNVIMI